MRKLKCCHKISDDKTRKEHNHNMKPSLSDYQLSDFSTVKHFFWGDGVPEWGQVKRKRSG